MGFPDKTGQAVAVVQMYIYTHKEGDKKTKRYGVNFQERSREAGL